jgi:hypothetical protein
VFTFDANVIPDDYIPRPHQNMNFTHLFRRLLIAVFYCIAGVAAVSGQIIIGSASGSTTALGPTPTSDFYNSGPRPAAPLATIASALANTAPLWQRGPVLVRPHFSHEVTHGTGLFRALGSNEKMTMQTLSPGVLIEAGTRASADYTLTRKWYSSRSLSDSTDHNTWLRGGMTTDDWKFGLSGNYGTNTNILTETGGQTREEIYATSAEISHRLGQKSELEVNGGHLANSSHSLAEVPIWPDSEWVLWTASAGLHYHLSPTLSFALGLASGYDKIESSPDMKHHRPFIKIRWQPTKKLSLAAEIGMERRCILTKMRQRETNSVYDVALSYNPLEPTRLTLSAARNVSPSYFSGESTQTDSWSVGLEQRFLKRIFFSAGISQNRREYDALTQIISQSRGDRFDSYNLRISTAILRNGTVAVFHQHSRNRSTLASYRYESDQIGAAFTYRL